MTEKVPDFYYALLQSVNIVTFQEYADILWALFYLN
jgi:hypothetical protein